MGQRALIAMTLIAGFELLIADEPTSALDVTVQLEVLAMLDKSVADRGMDLIFISHDLRLVPLKQRLEGMIVIGSSNVYFPEDEENFDAADKWGEEVVKS